MQTILASVLFLAVLLLIANDIWNNEQKHQKRRRDNRERYKYPNSDRDG